MDSVEDWGCAAGLPLDTPNSATASGRQPRALEVRRRRRQGPCEQCQTRDSGGPHPGCCEGTRGRGKAKAGGVHSMECNDCMSYKFPTVSAVEACRRVIGPGRGEQFSVCVSVFFFFLCTSARDQRTILDLLVAVKFGHLSRTVGGPPACGRATPLQTHCVCVCVSSRNPMGQGERQRGGGGASPLWCSPVQ